jgi:beta-glucosidase
MSAHRRPWRAAVCAAAGATLVLGLVASPAAPQPQAPDEELADVSQFPWGDTSLSSEERADLLIDAMTDEEKIEQIAMELDNAGPENNDRNPPKDANGNKIGNEDLPGCQWYQTGRHLEGMPEKGIPSIRMTNGPSGVGGGDCKEDPEATGLPSGLGVAASFDRGLARAWGDIGGAETRANAHAVFLAPGVNLGRIANLGRNFEYFGEDPYLSGVMGVEQVIGIQENDVHANIKHYAFNEQETERRSANIVTPPRAAHELYLLPFEMAAKDANVASMMCSFPRVHGTYACENPQLLTQIAREQWGWNGYFLSDRRATMSTIASIDAGFDLEFPRRVQFSEERIRAALDGNLQATEDAGGNKLPAESGQITWDQIEAMLHRRFTQMFEFGLIDNPITGFMPDAQRQAMLADHAVQAEGIAAESMVLMKNQNGALPLDAGALKSIAVLGARHFSQNAKFGPNSPNLNSTVNAAEQHIVGPIEGLQNSLEELGADPGIVDYYPIDGSKDYQAAVNAVGNYDAVILMVGDLSVEGSDRSTLRLPGPDDWVDDEEKGIINFEQTKLITDVAKRNGNTVVVLKNGGPVITNGWAQRVPAILEAWYPGQADGDAVARVLFGQVNPSGKLPMTFPITEREAGYATESQFPGLPTDEFAPVEGDPEFGAESGVVLESTYTEDLEMGYRWYEKHGITPPFAFGHGLSYTTFEYSDLGVELTENAGGNPALEVTFTVTNTGDVAGAEAAQVYLTLPDEAGEPSKRLVEFAKPHLEPGASEAVTVTIDHDASNHPLSYFVPVSDDPDEWQEEGSWADGDWATASGTYTVHVGGSSADTPLEADVQSP